jgi:hypothetical protein
MNTPPVWLCVWFFVLTVVYVIRYLRAHDLFARVIRWMIGKGKLARSPVPDKIDSNGLNHVVKYVARLVKSPSSRCSLIIASPDRNIACLIRHGGGQLHVMESAPVESFSRLVKRPFRKLNPPPDAFAAEKEQALRELFAELQIAPHAAVDHDDNGYTDAMSDLHYPIGNEIGEATRTIQRLLREVYYVQEADGLYFTYEG